MKLAIIVRKDLGMSCGKIAVQVGHASVAAFDYINRFHHTEGLDWYFSGQKKIVLKVDNEEMLHSIGDAATNNGINVEKIYDLGLTQISPNTLTCIAIGPCDDKMIDIITHGLKLL
jgi:peptidyl-tRNA hydrolase, PTH2 family